MAILEKLQPTQAVQCDLCGVRFDRQIATDMIRSGWEDVSITIWPNIGDSGERLFSSKGYIKIEHACKDCREKFTEKVRVLIEEMKTYDPA